MKQTILYDEGYAYDVKLDANAFSIHFDYGTRYNQINMPFSHFHPHFEIYCLLNGASQHFVEGRSFNLATYDFVLLRPYRLHRTNYLKHQPCKRLIIQFSLDFLNALLPDDTQAVSRLFDVEAPVYRFTPEQTTEMMHLFNQMYKASKPKGATTDLLITGLFIQLMDRLFRYHGDNCYFLDHKESLQNHLSPIEGKIYDITSHIHRHYDEDLTLDNLAARFFISPHYLSRQFKKTTGFTLIQYIQETRIKRAQELLLDTDMKIIDIIDPCGFGSISQFNRVFSNLVGTSPSNYRKANRL